MPHILAWKPPPPLRIRRKRNLNCHINSCDGNSGSRARAVKYATVNVAAPFAWLGALDIIQYAVAVISLGIGPGTPDCDETIQVEKALLHIRTG